MTRVGRVIADDTAVLHPNLANVTMTFALCSALYIRMILPVLFWSRISTAAPRG